MRYTLSLTLAVFVCLAGCGGVFGTDSTTTHSSTPAAVPTDDPLEYLPPGLTIERIENAFALAEAHTQALNGTDYTKRSQVRLTAANGTDLVDSVVTTRVTANHSRTYSIMNGSGSFVRLFDRPTTGIESWYDGDRYYYRGEVPNGTTYRSLVALGTPGQVVAQTLQPFYLNTDTVRVTASGEHLDLRVTGFNDVRPVGSRGVNVTESTLTVRLTTSGRVLRYRIETSGRLVEAPETTVTGVETVTFSRFDRTTVRRPAWVDEARAASNRTTRTSDE